MSDALSFPIATPPVAGKSGAAKPIFDRIAEQDLLGLRGFNLRRIAWTFAFAVGFASWSIIANGVFGDGDLDLDAFVIWLYRNASYFFPTMLAMTVADNLPLRGTPRRAALTLALVAGMAVSHPTICLLEPANYQCDEFPSWESFIAGWRNNLSVLSYNAVIAIAYFTLRRDREIAAALRTAEMERVAFERRTLESDLQVMQARVAPEFLLDTLRHIAELYGHDPQTGDRMLEELVIHLRAALPDARGSSSTLGREIELVRAWLAIIEIRSGGRVSFTVDADPGLDGAIFPPMTMLPLVSSAVPADLRESVSGRTRIVASRDGRSLRVLIDGAIADPRSKVSAEALKTLRGRLQALYGVGASLEIETDVGEPEIVLQIPLELEARTG